MGIGSAEHAKEPKGSNGVLRIPIGEKLISTSATFPTTLYTVTDAIVDNTLTQSEWQQVTVEIEAVQGALGVSGTVGLTAVHFQKIATSAVSISGPVLYIDSSGNFAFLGSAGNKTIIGEP